MIAISRDLLLTSLPIELEPSGWTQISQNEITAFAKLTNDWQGIHCDHETAVEAGYSGTIAHGFLILSHLSQLAFQSGIKADGASHCVNYGFDRVRFLKPVPSDSRFRGLFKIESSTQKNENTLLLKIHTTVEVENQEGPSLVADWLVLFQFNATADLECSL